MSSDRGEVGLKVVDPMVSAFDRFESARLMLFFFLRVA
jgi:hypothetical protein